ncbi:conserved exported protein of unknown function [Xenorhabdus poinarii G6]|uniref:Uncharacterized protein n=1 Tax=Xenorhabdus poinarii G6 TaxID=1354304 RepID=A0A068R6L9_9GAMM|nr:hypothetical protein [Xenorhabdus poinarii]CDG22922.1 conserved exported protein of unknown function [Xenorhabdus poinarii G6]
MRLLTRILFFFYLILISQPSIAKFSTPIEINQQLQERGVNSVVAEINEKYEQDDIIHHISTGDPQWLQIAFDLLPNIHTEFSKKIVEALSVALTENPVAVLALVKAHRILSITDICHLPPTLQGRSQKEALFRKMMNSLNAAEKSSSEKNRENIEICRWELEKVSDLYL